MKRLGIFVFFNKQGRVEKYVEYLLENIRPCLDELCIVSNCNLLNESKCKLKKYADELYVRENFGLDAAAYKAALLSYCGIEKVRSYDEVVCFNDTMYGPFIPFKSIFETMEQRNVDFWGIMAGYKTVNWMQDQLDYEELGLGDEDKSCIPEHIQSWFRVFRKTITNSAEFEAYWKNYNDHMNSFWEVVLKHEVIFTRYFERLGYKWDIFCESEPFKSDSLNQNFNFYGYATECMLRYMKMPFLKRKPFALGREEIIYMNGGEDFKKALDYLAENSDYPLEYIYEDLLHNGNVYDIYSSLHLDFIISPETEIICDTKKVAVVVQCSSEKSFNFIAPYLRRVSASMDIYIHILKNEEKNFESEIRELCAVPIYCEDKGIFILKHIKDIKDYDYVIFIHDAIELFEDKPFTIYQSIWYNYMENLVGSLAYVKKMITQLESNPQLGLLLAPMPIHNKYFNFFGNTWGNYYKCVENITKALRLKCNITEQKPVISASGCFCCKGVILYKILEMPCNNKYYEDICKTEIYGRLLPFLAQDAGYYTGTIMSAEYASVECLNERFYLERIMEEINVGEVKSFSEYLYKVNQTCINKNKMNLILKEKDAEIDRLYHLTSLKVQLKLRLKKFTPSFIYHIVLTMKRLIFGPRDIIFDHKQ